LAALFWRVPEVIVDASRYFTQAKYLELYGIEFFVREWGKAILSWTDLPLVPFLYGLIFKFFGESRLFIQVVTTLLFSATIVLTSLIGKELWDEETGLYGGILLLGIPYLFVQVPLMLVDVPTMFFFTLAVFAFIRALGSKGTATILVSSVSLFLAFLSKYSTWPMLSILVVIVFVFIKVQGQGSVRHTISRGVVTFLAAALLAGVVIFCRFEVFSEQIKLLISYQRPGLGRWEESFISTFFFQVHPFITLSAIVSVWVAIRGRDPKYLIIIWLPLLLMVFQVQRIRYTIPLFPMLTLMASYGLQQIGDKDARRFIASCIVMSSVVVALCAYLPFTQKMSAANLRDAGGFLDTLDEKEIEVFTLLPKEPVVNPAVEVALLDLYTRKRIIYHGEFGAAPGRDIISSPLRFTWEYKNPSYYAVKDKPCDGEMATVILSGEGGGDLPSALVQKLKNYREVIKFNADEGVFEHKTFVSVYRQRVSESGEKRH
ncbi:MAG TPA: glycosyltransferase family 39 protein, partial [Thermodesulfovibrionales bacterium]|nr:glycosyltransferase family 39 protein [Thermodesulfovibrionales bacterium]